MNDPQPPTPPPLPRGGPLRWVLSYTRGLIVDQHLRRLTMFYVVIAAMLMAFAGDMFFTGWLRERLVRFVVYWLVCGWLTILAALLAVYDLILLSVQRRFVERQLRERMLGKTEDGKDEG